MSPLGLINKTNNAARPLWVTSLWIYAHSIAPLGFKNALPKPPGCLGERTTFSVATRVLQQCLHLRIRPNGDAETPPNYRMVARTLLIGGGFDTREDRAEDVNRCNMN